MTGVLERALGLNFPNLHPKVRWRFGFDSASHVRQRGVGVVEELSHSHLLPAPALWPLAARRALPARTGMDIPFTIENYAYRDALGRETYALVRTLDYPKGAAGEMDSVMVGSQHSRAVVDYLGTDPLLVLRTKVWVDSTGALRLSSGPPRFLLPLTPRLPVLLSAVTETREWWDGDRHQHGVQVEVRNPVLGRLLFYRAHYTATEEAWAPDRVPPRARTRRVLSRE